MNLDSALKILQSSLLGYDCASFSTEEHATLKYNWHSVQCGDLVQERQSLFTFSLISIKISSLHTSIPLRRFHSASSFILQSKIVMIPCIFISIAYIGKEKINQERSATPDTSLCFLSQWGISFPIYMYTCA